MNRIHLEDTIYYITTVAQDRLPIFTRPSMIIPLVDSLNFYRYKLEFYILGYVIMPDHLHLLIWLYGKPTISDIMRDFKKFTAGRIVRQVQVEKDQKWIAAFQQAGKSTGRSENKVWQDDFWDKIIFTEKFLRQKLNYIHRNPVRAGLVDDPATYPYSSYRNYVYDDNTLITIDSDCWL